MWSLAIRVVLSLCLVLNGLGTAHARVHPSDRSSLHAQAQAAAAVASAPCHGTHATNVTPKPVASHPTATLEETGAPAHDCCHLAGCDGQCLHHAPAAMEFWLSTPIITRAQAGASVSYPHAPPALPPLTRPPIV